MTYIVACGPWETVGALYQNTVDLFTHKTESLCQLSESLHKEAL